jgi:hypothetical protein
MALRMVTYDLIKEKPRGDYESILKIIRAGGAESWRRLSESSYAMDTTKTPQQLYAEFKPHLDDNDNLYILTLCSPWFGQNTKETNDWMTARLPVN